MDDCESQAKRRPLDQSVDPEHDPDVLLAEKQKITRQRHENKRLIKEGWLAKRQADDRSSS